MMTTVWPISMVNENVVPGVAFEPKEMGEETYDHLDERVKELTDARGTMQRSFFHRSMRTVKVVNPETGKKESKREATGWTDTRKYTNARHLAIQRALSPTGRLSGTRREKRKSTLVTVIIINGIDPKAMGQMFADLNGKGITLGASEVAALDIRDPWHAPGPGPMPLAERWSLTRGGRHKERASQLTVRSAASTTAAGCLGG